MEEGNLQNKHNPSDNYHKDLGVAAPLMDDFLMRLGSEGNGHWFFQMCRGVLISCFSGIYLLFSLISVVGITLLKVYEKVVPFIEWWMVILLVVLYLYFLIHRYKKRMLNIRDTEFNLSYFKKERAEEYAQYWGPILNQRVNFTTMYDHMGSLLSSIEGIEEGLEKLKDFHVLLQQNYASELEHNNILSQHLMQISSLLQRASNRGEIREHDLLMVFEKGLHVYEFDGDQNLRLVIDEGTSSNGLTSIPLDSVALPEVIAFNEGYSVGVKEKCYRIDLKSGKVWLLVLSCDTLLLQNIRNSDLELQICTGIIRWYYYHKGIIDNG